MQGQYPKGVCYIVDGQGGCRGSIPRGSAEWSWTGRRQGQYPKGVCIMVDGPDGRRAVYHRYLR